MGPDYRGSVAAHAFRTGDTGRAPQRRRCLTRARQDVASISVRAGFGGAGARGLPATYGLKPVTFGASQCFARVLAITTVPVEEPCNILEVGENYNM
jgi:hypothetical protein